MTRTIVGFVSVCLVLAMLVLHAGDVHATPNWIAEFDILGQCCVDSPIQDSSGNILIDQFNNGNNVLIHRNFTITANEVFGVRGIAGAGTYTGMYMEGTDPASWPFYGYATNGVAQAWHYFDGASGQWRLYNSGDQIAVTQAGNVGIGTTVPAFTLDVAGPAHASSFPTSSDIRFKTDVRPLTGVVEKLEKIRGVSFEWSERYQGRLVARRGTKKLVWWAKRWRPYFQSWSPHGAMKTTEPSITAD